MVQLMGNILDAVVAAVATRAGETCFVPRKDFVT